MDIVICLAAKDYRIVKKVVRGCREYLQKPSDSIFIITNKNNNFFFFKKWKKKNRVVLVDEDMLVDGLSFTSVKMMLEKHFQAGTHIYPGWYFQQFLKMGFALSTYAKSEYLIWDSDTIPLHKLTYKKNDKYLFTVKTENHHPYFYTLQNLLGFGKLYDRSFIAEHMPISTHVMRELVDKISHSHVDGKTWVEKIINATSGCDEQAFSEFETYGNYCVKYHPDLFETRPLITMRTAGMLFGRGVNRNQLALLSRMGYDTASFEIRDMPSFPRNLFNWWERLVLRMYRDLGLVKK